MKRSNFCQYLPGVYAKILELTPKPKKIEAVVISLSLDQTVGENALP